MPLAGGEPEITARGAASAPVVRAAAVPPVDAVAPAEPGVAPDGVPEETDDERARPTARAEAREGRRLRAIAIGLVILVLVGAVPLFVAIRAATRDPVLTTLDGLDVPGWAAVQTDDAVSGSRWCLIDCRLRERTVESQGTPDDTATSYETALAGAGWRRWQPAQMCPEQKVEGHYTCWQRDELTLDLWVRPPSCATAPLVTEPPVDPAATPSAAAGGEACAGAVVSIKVRNAIDDERTRPGPSTDPSLTGEDPDPIFTDDPLLDPTPTPS